MTPEPKTQSPFLRVREIVLWSAVGFLYAGLAWGLGSARSFEPWGEYIIASRAVLATLALSAALCLLWRRALPQVSGSLFALFALGIQSTHALVEGPSRLGSFYLAALVFLATAKVFQGSRRDWQELFFPLCSFLLVLPALFKQESVLALALAGSAVVLVGGLGWMREQRERTERASLDLRELLETRISVLTANKSVFEEGHVMKNESNNIYLCAEKAPISSERDSSLSLGESQIFSLPDVLAVMERVLARKKSEQSKSRGVALSWTRTVDANLPVAVQINADDLARIVASLIDQGIESLGGGDGVVRLGLHPGLRQIQITVEDNGRGMSEELLLRLQSRGMAPSLIVGERLSFQQIRTLIGFWGGRVYRHARLGVGSRVTVEIPRVDAFATPFASSRGLESRVEMTLN